jgi:hypothetical protein
MYAKDIKEIKEIEKEKEKRRKKNIKWTRGKRFGPDQKSAHGPVPLNQNGTLRWPHPR